ncbi:MAG: glycosyltransferase family 2 protein, partial [Bryobacteraceae bacterium]
YPLLLSLYARRFPIPVEKWPSRKRLSIIVPVRNGERWLEEKIRSLLASDYPAELIDILIVSDGSADGTNDLAHGYPDSRVRLLPLPPGGKAVAVSRGIENVSGEIIVLTDVRQTFDRDALTRLAACFASPSVGVVTGELVIREGLSLAEYNTGLYWRYEKWIRRNLNRIDAMLGATGSIYAIRRELASPVPSNILLDDVYIPLDIAARGFRIYFEDGAKAYDVPSSLHTEFWRKVRTQAGVYQIIFRFPGLLWPGNRRFVHFLSHKMGRLMLPFALLAIAISSFSLTGPWRMLAMASQAVFYGLALVDPAIPERNPLKRYSAIVRAFVVLVAAALCAVAVFFVPARVLWKETRKKQREVGDSK